MIVVLIGPSGAGKGTQADRIADERRFLHISTGDLFRDHLERKTRLGKRVKRYVERGELVPEEIVQAMIRDHLERLDPAQDVILDGYPRTEDQAAAFDDMLRALGRELEGAVYLDVSDEAVVSDRIPGRLTCRVCQRPYHERFAQPKERGTCDRCGGPLYHREDDTPEFANRRLRTFHREVAPIVDYYQRAGKLVVVDGGAAIGPVHEKMERIVEALRRDDVAPAAPAEVDRIRAQRAGPRTLPEGAVCPLTLDLVLLGPPGAGKGTQAEALRRRFEIPHISTGDLFRDNIRKETELGRLAKSYMDRGDLVPDDVTEAMVRNRLADTDTVDGFLLDGFPRTRAQADSLTDMLTDLNRRLSGVLSIRVADEEIVRRLSGRRICRECQTTFHVDFLPPKREGVCDACGGELYQRDDDAPETVRARLETFRRQTAPLIDHYRAQGLLVEIDGEGEIASVTERTVGAAEKLKRW